MATSLTTPTRLSPIYSPMTVQYLNMMGRRKPPSKPVVARGMSCAACTTLILRTYIVLNQIITLLFYTLVGCSLFFGLLNLVRSNVYDIRQSKLRRQRAKHPYARN